MDERAGSPPPAVDAVTMAECRAEHRDEETIQQAENLAAWEDEGGTTASRPPAPLHKN